MTTAVKIDYNKTKKLVIEIEADSSMKVDKIFEHIYKEITEPDYYDSDMEREFTFRKGWVNVGNVEKSGRYRWIRHI